MSGHFESVGDGCALLDGKSGVESCRRRADFVVSASTTFVRVEGAVVVVAP